MVERSGLLFFSLTGEKWQCFLAPDTKKGLPASQHVRQQCVHQFTAAAIIGCEQVVGKFRIVVIAAKYILIGQENRTAQRYQYREVIESATQYFDNAKEEEREKLESGHKKTHYL